VFVTYEYAVSVCFSFGVRPFSFSYEINRESYTSNSKTCLKLKET
jgi:hypothetical protein